MDDRNDWQSENERKEDIRRMKAQMEYDIYNAPDYVKKGSGIIAAVFIACLALLLILGTIRVSLAIIGVWPLG